MRRTDLELEFPPSLYFSSSQEIQTHLHARVPGKLQRLLDAENGREQHILVTDIDFLSG
jgi:hypothetical protein